MSVSGKCLEMKRDFLWVIITCKSFGGQFLRAVLNTYVGQWEQGDAGQTAVWTVSFDYRFLGACVVSLGVQFADVRCAIIYNFVSSTRSPTMQSKF